MAEQTLDQYVDKYLVDGIEEFMLVKEILNSCPFTLNLEHLKSYPSFGHMYNIVVFYRDMRNASLQMIWENLEDRYKYSEKLKLNGVVTICLDCKFWYHQEDTINGNDELEQNFSKKLLKKLYESETPLIQDVIKSDDGLFFICKYNEEFYGVKIERFNILSIYNSD